MSDYLECQECGSDLFRSEWDHVECENGHECTCHMPPKGCKSSAAVKAVVTAAMEHEGTCDGSCTGTRFQAALVHLASIRRGE